MSKPRTTTAKKRAPAVAAPKIPTFGKILRRAAKRKGDLDALEALMSKPKSTRSLARVSDDRWLSACTKAVFNAGFVWRVVENKWEGFETAFHNFDVKKVATRTDRQLDKLTQDERIIRNRTKIWATRDNARYIADCAMEHGSFGKMIARWPVEDLVGLYAELHRGGSRLGGASAQYFMRAMGKDTYILTPSVAKALQIDKIIDKAPTPKRAKAHVQAAFNAWHAETGRPMCQISQILAYSVP